MDELLKTSRLIHFTITIASFTMLTFLYPLHLARVTRDVYQRAIDLQFAVGDFQRSLKDIEADIRRDLRIAADQAAYAHGYQLRDETRWYQTNEFVFVDGGGWLLDDNARTIDEIDDSWRRAPLVPIYGPADVSPFVKAVQERTPQAAGYYLIRSIALNRHDDGASIDVLVSPPTAAPDISFRLPLKQIRTVDAREYLRRHRSSRSFITSGDLSRDLLAREELRGTPLQHGLQRLGDAQEKNPESVSVMGITVNATGLALFAPAILAALLIYLHVHFAHVVDAIKNATDDERRVLLRFPWTPLYTSKLSNAIDFVTLFVLPACAAGAVAIATTSAFYERLWFRSILIGEAIIVTALAAAAFRYARIVARATASIKSPNQ